jgi:hypothetical protein
MFNQTIFAKQIDFINWFPNKKYIFEQYGFQTQSCEIL